MWCGRIVLGHTNALTMRCHVQHDNHEHLALMQRMLGPIPSHMIRKARGPAREFFDRGTLVWPGRRTQPKRIDVVKKVKKLEVRPLSTPPSPPPPPLLVRCVASQSIPSRDFAIWC